VTENFNYSQTVEVFRGRSYDEDFLPDNLAVAIVWLQAKISSVPAEFRDKTTIELDGSYDYGMKIIIEYQRPPTEDEIATRRDASRKSAEDNIAQAKARVVREEQKLAALGGAV
jgi:hypothetical protein